MTLGEAPLLCTGGGPIPSDPLAVFGRVGSGGAADGYTLAVLVLLWPAMVRSWLDEAGLTEADLFDHCLRLSR